MIKYFDGIPIIQSNAILKSSKEEDYYVSYNSSRRDYDVETTALVVTIGDNERIAFYILKGNHSEQYKNCSNLKDCISYFWKNKDKIHDFSDVFEHEHLLSNSRGE